MKNKPIVIDLFCGAGGESQGIHWAMGDNIKLFAVNHWQRAVESHSRNFPSDEAICQDIQAINPRKLVGNQEVELLWASPECTHFSNARGGKPMDDQSRCTPWDILRWLEKVNVKRLIIENVKEFMTWGPLDENNRPVKDLKGTFFGMFIRNIQQFGYEVQYRILNAADYGAPTSRRRLILQAVKIGCGKKLCWPNVTHAPVKVIEKDGLFESELKPYVPAKDIIDWSIPSQPINMRKKPLAENTMKRIESGIRKYWGDYAEPFLVRYNGGDDRHHSIHEPVPTLDTSNRYGLVTPFIVELRGQSNHRSINEPLSTVSCSGAHHALVEPLIMEYYGNGRCYPVSKPLGVLTTKERFALIQGNRLGLSLRMLVTHEMSMAQGFKRDYFFSGTKTDQVEQIGNSVSPVMAEAVVEAGMG